MRFIDVSKARKFTPFCAFCLYESKCVLPLRKTSASSVCETFASSPSQGGKTESLSSISTKIAPAHPYLQATYLPATLFMSVNSAMTIPTVPAPPPPPPPLSSLPPSPLPLSTHSLNLPFHGLSFFALLSLPSSPPRASNLFSIKPPPPPPHSPHPSFPPPSVFPPPDRGLVSLLCVPRLNTHEGHPVSSALTYHKESRFRSVR